MNRETDSAEQKIPRQSTPHLAPNGTAIPEERVDSSGIEWKHFTNENEVQFVNDQPKRLTLTNWTQTSLYGEPAIRFEVTHEEGVSVKKSLTTRSKRLIRQLKPLMTEAIARGEGILRLAITRTGSGYETDYDVQELPDEPEQDTG